jgi:hypothetical protein
MEEQVDQIFSVATGWLGWTPEVAMTTPLAAINLALEGKIDFLKKTNPWGSADDEAETDFASRKPDPEGAAKAFIAMIEARKPKPMPAKEKGAAHG